MDQDGLAAVQRELRDRVRDAYAGVHFGVNDPIPQPAEYSFEWWFNYFFNECPLPVREEVYRAWLDPGGTVKNVQRSIRDMRAILQRMLDEGFMVYPAVHEQGDGVLFPEKGSVRVGFRGDSRPPRDVEAHAGTWAKATVPALQTQMNMNQLWHPYFTLGPSQMYFRKGQRDACLQTVVSIGTDFLTVTKFPLLHDVKPADRGVALVKGRRHAARPVVERRGGPALPVSAKIRGLAQQFGGVETAVESENVQLIATRTNVYILRVGRAYNTEAMQRHQQQDLHTVVASPFPERAVRGVPWSHHLARFQVERIHYGGDCNEGHLIVVRGWEWLHTPDELARVLGGAGRVDSLGWYLEGLAREGALAGGISRMEYLPAGVARAVEVVKVNAVQFNQEWV